MIWGLAALAVIIAGLPAIAWTATRGMARRPAAPLKPYHDRMDQWIHRQYGLDWADCRPIRKAVAEGSRVTNPALEDAAHQLAAATLSGKVPGARRVRLLSMTNLVLGVVLVGSGNHRPGVWCGWVSRSGVDPRSRTDPPWLTSASSSVPGDVAPRRVRNRGSMSRWPEDGPFPGGAACPG